MIDDQEVSMPRYAFLPVLLALGAVGGPASFGAGPARADMLIVLNKSDHEAVLVDPATLEVLGKLPTGHGPHEAAVSPDGKTAWVCNYGAVGVFRGESERKFQAGNTLTVLDLAKRKVVKTIDLGDFKQPHGIAFSRDGKKVWLTCEGAGAVIEVDAASGKVGKSWKTGQEVSHMLVATPDEKKLYIANIRSGTATVIDRASGGVKTIPTGAGAEGIDVRPDGLEVWVTNRAANTVSVIDVAKDTVVANLPSGGNFPIRVKFTPDGREAWVSNAQSNAVAIFDARTREKVGEIAVGAVPIGIQMSPDGRRAFVANTNDDQVTALDVTERKVAGVIKTGNEPDGMAWSSIPVAKK